MRNYYRAMLENFTTFYMNNDDIVPLVKYGVAPPTYMNTDPRFDKRPYSQATPASGRNSSMAPNPQAGMPITVHRREPQPQVDNPISGRLSRTEDDAVYRDDPRSDELEKTVKVASLGHPVVPQTGVESVIDFISGPYDRDPGEVNTPVVYGNPRAYQGSDTRYSTGPEWLLGASNYGPRPSQFTDKDEVEDFENHPDQIWIQEHPNVLAHTIGHDHPYNHQDRYPKPVKFSHNNGTVNTFEQP